MKESTIRFEFVEAHKRMDQLTDSNNANTDATIESMYRIRAFENLINRNWLLSRILGVRKVNDEVDQTFPAKVENQGWLIPFNPISAFVLVHRSPGYSQKFHCLLDCKVFFLFHNYILVILCPYMP